jgi:hypothetical protein
MVDHHMDQSYGGHDQNRCDDDDECDNNNNNRTLVIITFDTIPDIITNLYTGGGDTIHDQSSGPSMVLFMWYQYFHYYECYWYCDWLSYRSSRKNSIVNEDHHSDVGPDNNNNNDEYLDFTGPFDTNYTFT